MRADPVLLIDLSNVCRDEALVPAGNAADWTAYERLLSAMEQSDIDFSRVHAIADRSLLRLLDQQGRARFRQEERAGALEVSALADERLLAYAYDPDSQFCGALIVSKDRFSDFRRTYPEIQGCTNRFISWHVGKDGVLRTSFRDMGVDSHATMSRKEETGELKARRLRREDIRRRAKAHYFQCANKACLLARLWPDHLRELPLYDDRRDHFLCPTCKTELAQLGLRQESVQLIVFLDGAEQTRILLQRGEQLAVGRTDGQGCLGLQRILPKADSSAVSRRHLELAWRGGQVQVRDLGSKNGTLKRDRRGSEGHRLGQEAWTPLRRGDTVLMPASVSIEVSGREVVFEGERPLMDPPDDGTDSPTRLVP